MAAAKGSSFNQSQKKKQNVQTHSEKKTLLNIEIMTMISELKG